MALIHGTRLGPYEIVSPVGAGGMGEVYRGRDTKLNRDVAIKVLPESFALDADRVARFTREAQVLASLNHPNIAQIYGIESNALVMELVEGEDLSAIIARGPIAPADALPIARQIADALEAAHELGIVHRDLKPQNIKVRADGAVKVLDFGLAKAADPAASSGVNAMNSPTMTSPAMTGMGMILGTAAYMSPEQAKGRVVDKRADIWAFGVVLYEMLSGARAFKGDDVSEILVSVLRDTVDVNALPASVPPRLRALIARCLERDVKLRLRDIGEARVELAKIADGRYDASSPGIPVVAKTKSPTLPWAIAAVLFVAAITASIFWWRERAAAPTTRMAVALPADVTFSLGLMPLVAISRDGSQIALVARLKGVPNLYVRLINEFEPRLLAGTEGASSPFFNPDGTWIGFMADGKLKKVQSAGGPVITLAEGLTDNRGGVWTDRDTIIYAPGPAAPVYQIPAAGGTPAIASTIDEARHERTHRWPSMLPDGQTVLVTVGSVERPDDYDDATIEAIRLDTGARHTVVKGGRSAHYVSSGHLLYLRGKVLYAVEFDLKNAAVRGTPVPVIDGISGDATTGSGHYAVSDNGTIVFVPGDPSGGVRQLAWVDAQGKEAIIDIPPAFYADPRVSPDGRRVAVSIASGGSRRDIVVIDAERGTTSRLTSDRFENRTPSWTHDGRRLIYVAFDGTRNVSKIMSISVDGSGGAHTITELGGQAYVEDLTRDDGSALVAANPSTARSRFEIFKLELKDGAKPVRLIASATEDVSNSALSPDGKWVAYFSVEAGQAEVFVQSFAGNEARAHVSVSGGVQPRWSADGRTLYYQDFDKLMAVPIESGPGFRPGKPRVVLTGVATPITDSGQTYDVDRSSPRFLMLRLAGGNTVAPHARVILNWFEELKKLAQKR